MIDFGFDKIALIGAVALIVIGPEKLPKVARTVGHLFGKAQRYVADVKAEVNRSIELDELKKMKSDFEDAARSVEQTVQTEINAASAEFEKDWAAATGDVTFNQLTGGAIALTIGALAGVLAASAAGATVRATAATRATATGNICSSSMAFRMLCLRANFMRAKA